MFHSDWTPKPKAHLATVRSALEELERGERASTVAVEGNVRVMHPTRSSRYPHIDFVEQQFGQRPLKLVS